MKKIVVSMLVMLTAFSAIAATNVSSVNAVGYIKHTITNGEWKLISVPFDPLGTNLTFKASDLFTNNLPVGTKAYYWRPTIQQWAYTAFGYSMGAGTNVWQPNTNFVSGQAIYMNAPTSPVGSSTFTILGNVPVDTAIEVPLTNGFTLIGYPYPVAMNITNTTLGKNAAVNDRVYFWENNQWRYIAWGYSMGAGTNIWQPSNIVIQAGMGLFYKTGTNAVNNEVRPFPWD